MTDISSTCEMVALLLASVVSRGLIAIEDVDEFCGLATAGKVKSLAGKLAERLKQREEAIMSAAMAGMPAGGLVSLVDSVMAYYPKTVITTTPIADEKETA